MRYMFTRFFPLLLCLIIAGNAFPQCTSTFKLSLKGSASEFGYDIVEIAGGDVIIGGQTTSFGSGGSDIFLTRITKEGKIIWNKTYGGTGDEQIRKIRLANDGDILVTGQTKSYGNANGEVLSMKIDVNGNTKWAVKLGEGTGYSLGLDIISTTDNGFIVSGTDYAPDATSDWLVAKLDALGNVLWTKRFDYGINEDAFALIQKGDTIIISGNSQTTADYSGVLVKLALSDGSVYNSQAYTVDGRGAFSSKIQYASNQYRLSIHIIDGNSYAQMQEGFIIMDTLLNTLRSFKINAAAYNNFYFTGFWQTKDSGFIATGSPATSNEGYLYKFDKLGNLAFTRKFSSGLPFLVYSAVEMSDSTIWITGSENNHVLVIKLNAAGEFAYCQNATVQSLVVPISFQNAAFNWATISSYNFQPPNISLPSAAFTFNVDSLCFAPVCGLKMMGQDTVCNISDTITYVVKRVGACNTTINWSIPVGQYSKTINDTTIQIVFSTGGLYKIAAISNANCNVFGDSLSVLVHPTPSSVALGADTIVCNAARLQLDAGPGFQQYTWQDNNNQQTYNVTTPGTYYVTAKTICGVIYTDTIKVDFRSIADFHVSPADTAYCIPSTIQFKATGGDVYSWSPATFLNNPSISNPVASPASSILYALTITDTVCKRTAELPVNIFIDPVPTVVISKTNDIDCSTGSSQLMAKGGSSYLWSPLSSLNDGQISSPIATPLQTTTYHVTAYNSLGCSTEDSITLFFTKTGNAEIFLPNAFSPNGDGKNDVFRIISPGAVQLYGFNVYNRWGELVFTTKDISKGWDGNFNGVRQPPGVFVWYVKAWTPCNGNIFKKGTVVLVR